MIRLAALVVLALLAPALARGADAFPSRPIRLIIPAGAGGITDIVGRFIAAKMSESLGQQVVIDNRPGASGLVGSQIVAKSTPDGYTLLMVFPSHPVNPSLFTTMPYDTLTAFAPVTLVSQVSPVLIVNAPFAARSVKELIAIAKDRPGELNHASVGRGSMGHLASELFRSMAGIRIAQIVYKGSPQALNALVGGEVHFYFIGSAGTVVPHANAGRIRALAVGSKQRIAALPEVPPVADTLPGFEVGGWNGILAPAHTPRPIIERLHGEIVKVVRSPEFARHLAAEGASAVGNTPGEFSAVIQADMRKWARVVREAGIKTE
jgi:tripartite-type tricarboxylate transporter receptor subunit TctC